MNLVRKKYIKEIFNSNGIKVSKAMYGRIEKMICDMLCNIAREASVIMQSGDKNKDRKFRILKEYAFDLAIDKIAKKKFASEFSQIIENRVKKSLDDIKKEVHDYYGQ